MNIYKKIIITELQAQTEEEPEQRATQAEAKGAGKGPNGPGGTVVERIADAPDDDEPERLKVNADDTAGMELRNEAAKQAALEQQRTRLARKRIVEAERKAQREAEEQEARIQVDMSTLDLGIGDDDLQIGMQLA